MTSPGDWLAIVNPASGLAGSRHGWDGIEAALRTAQVPLEVIRSAQPQQGEFIARQAVQQGRRRLIAVGGDGSVNDVVNGVMSAGLADTREVTLAVAPTGTGNDWARSLGIGRNAADVAAAIIAGHTTLHDVGIVEHPESGEPRRWFVNVAGAGYDAHMTSQLPRPIPSGLTYLRVALSELVAYRAPRFRVDADGTRVEGRMLLVFAANGQYCGNRMHVAPLARMDDGLIDVVMVRELGLLAVLPKLLKLYRGNILGDPVIRHFRAARVRIEADPPAGVQVDGQLAGSTPVEFSLLNRALRVIVPPEVTVEGRPPAALEAK
jgi:YegS/Rv2252/BmrU family lipid kinase